MRLRTYIGQLAHGSVSSIFLLLREKPLFWNINRSSLGRDDSLYFSLPTLEYKEIASEASFPQRVNGLLLGQLELSPLRVFCQGRTHLSTATERQEAIIFVYQLLALSCRSLLGTSDETTCPYNWRMLSGRVMLLVCLYELSVGDFQDGQRGYGHDTNYVILPVFIFLKWRS